MLDNSVAFAARLLQCEKEMFEKNNFLSGQSNFSSQNPKNTSKSLRDLTKVAENLLKQVPRNNSIKNMSRFSSLGLLSSRRSLNPQVPIEHFLCHKSLKSLNLIPRL